MKTTKLLLERDPYDEDWPDYINIASYNIDSDWQSHLPLETSVIYHASEKETCKMTIYDTKQTADYLCNEYIMCCKSCNHKFGYVQYGNDEYEDVWMNDFPIFCPHCGRKVVNDY